MHKALEVAWKIVSESNKLVDESRLWEITRIEEGKARETLERLAENIHAIASMLSPFMPDTAEKIFQSLGGKDAKMARFKKPEQPLFPRGRASAR